LPLRAGKQDVDARDTSAFTRVFDALCAGMTTGLTFELAPPGSLPLPLRSLPHWQAPKKYGFASDLMEDP
jgi:hypothetical protein